MYCVVRIGTMTECCRMREFAMSIDGAAVAAQQTFGVVDPATGQVFADAPACTRRQLGDATAGAAPPAHQTLGGLAPAAGQVFAAAQESTRRQLGDAMAAAAAARDWGQDDQ